MNYKIQNSNINDMQEISRLYQSAIEFQKIKDSVVWLGFDRTLIETEIAESRQWKMVVDGEVACIWVTTFDDPQIWEERNSEPSVYIHRIATNPIFRGRNLVNEIVKWAMAYAVENGKKYIRMDTVGENRGLINYYQKCGFEFLGLSTLKDTGGLPAHYHTATVSLFQYRVNNGGIIDKHNAGKYAWGTKCESFIFLETEGLSVKQEIMPQDTSEQLHFHEKAQQVFYVSKGEATFYVEEEVFAVKENQSIHIKPTQKHFVANNGNGELEFLVISQPSTKNDRIEINL